MCLNYIRAEQTLRTVSLYIAVNEIQFKMTHIDCECTHAFRSYLHLPNLNAASSVVWQKVLWPPKREPLLSYKLDKF